MSEYARPWMNKDGRILWQPVIGKYGLWMPSEGGRDWREWGKDPYLTSYHKSVRMARRKERKDNKQTWTQVEQGATDE